MKYTISLMLLMISIGLSQEAKIDSVAIQAEMDKLTVEFNRTVTNIAALEKHKDNIAYAWNVLDKMLVPKVEPVVEKDEGKNNE